MIQAKMFVFATTIIMLWTFRAPSNCRAELNTGICVRYIMPDENFKQIPYIDTREYITFLDMVEKSTVFIDRSLLAERIFDIKRKVIVITFPPRSGKSINLTMLKAFFEIRVNQTTKQVIPQKETATYKFFTEGKIIKGLDSPLQPRAYIFGEKLLHSNIVRVTTTLKNPPMIAKHEIIVDRHLANYPVIFVDLLFQTFFFIPNIIDNLRDEIIRVYNSHAFVKGMMKDVIFSNCTSEEAKEKARQDLREFEIYDKERIVLAQINDTDLENSLLILSRILYEYLDKPVIILMDGYSSALEYYLLYQEEPYTAEQQEESRLLIQNGVKLLRNFFRKSLAENPYLKKAVLTGSLSVNKKDLLADVSDFVHYNTITNDLQEFYGVTEKLLDILFDHFDIPSELGEKARNFYNGYIMEPNTNLTTYNTWSTINFLNFKKVAKYWVQHTNTFEKTIYWLDLRNIFHFLHPLLLGSGITVHFEEADFDKKGLLFAPRRISHKNAIKDVTQESINCIISLFCELGLLTFTERMENFDGNFWFRIANAEVQEGIVESIKGKKRNVSTIRPPNGERPSKIFNADFMKKARKNPSS